jgi:outer membrane protein assembly complex protein YaeT
MREARIDGGMRHSRQRPSRWACRSRAVRTAIVVVFMLGAATGVRADVGDYLERPITAVHLEIEGRRTVDRPLLRVLETRVGDALAMRTVRESVAHLISLGRFENVVVRATAEAKGVMLVYELTPVHPIERIEFAGAADAPGIDPGRLRAAVSDRFGSSIPIAQAAEIAAFVATELRARGYPRARVSVRTETRHAPDRTVLFLVLEPGERTRIAAIDVTAPSGVAPPDLPRRLGIVVGDPYEPETVGVRIEEYIADRRDEGYYRAGVTLTARFDDDDRSVHLTLAVAVGPRVRVVFRGDPVPAAVRDDLAPIASEGSADEDLLEDSTNQIEEYLRAQGYRDAAAPYAREQGAGDEAVVFTVRRGPLYRVARVEISGNPSVPIDELTGELRLREGQPFTTASLDADVSAIEDVYERLGFTAASVQSGVDPLPQTSLPTGQIPVVVRILIVENARTVVESVGVLGNLAVPEAELLTGVGLQPGRPFRLTQMAVDRDAIQLRYANLGYRHATVAGSPGLSADGTRAHVVFTVHEGPRLFVNHVIMVGLTRTRPETVERELQLTAGDPFGAAAVIESQQRLAALGLFRRLRLTELSHGDETTRDLLVAVEEAPATTIGYGGGVEAGPRTGREQTDGGAVERPEFRPRAFFEIGRRNLFGKNRSISLSTRVSLRSEDEPVPVDGEAVAGGSRFGFSEYRVLGTFREPRVFQTLADAFLTGTAERQIRPSFKFARRAFSAEVARAVTRTVGLSGNYQIQRTELFDERFNIDETRLIDRLFPQVRLSSFSMSAVRDTRDDQLSPTLGHYASVNTQLAARRIGSEVGFVRSFLTAQFFRQLPGPSRIVLATSARFGLAAGFPREVARADENGRPVTDADGQAIVDVVEDLPASERFFAGGDTTVRGFALDQLGTPATIDQDGFPIGGNAMSIFNAELRVPVFRSFGLVGFFDVGNVFARTADIDFGEMRSALGFGFRYASPVGPLRVDLGFKTDRREIVGGRRENLTALHISLGQAF